LTTSLLSLNEAQLGYQRYLIENPSYFSTYDQWKLDVSSDFIIDPNARFHVRFMSEGVELETYESIVSGSRIDLLSPEKVGHTFLGWFMSESVHAAQFTDESVVQSQLTLYAKWSINRYKIEYFKDNAIVHTDYYYYGESLRLHPGLSKDGFAFIAWQNSLNLTISNPTMPAENLKLYAKQAGKILDMKRVELKFNSRWLSKLSFEKVMEIASEFTLQQMIERYRRKLEETQDYIQRLESIRLD
jgi:uncharacterized repeat protein (TIGR02543 family)